MSFFTNGITGMNAAQVGLRTASHNIANASTPGFNRQYISQSTNTPLFTGAGFLGQGTNVETVKRVYNDLLTQQVRAAETNVAELSTYFAQIKQIDNLLADPSAGLSPALQSFFASVAETAANPASIPARQAMLSGAESLVARFNAMDQQLTAMRSGVNGQIVAELDTINTMVKQVANLNDRILVAQAASANQPANDLYDQRDHLIAELNREIRVTTQLQTDGSVNLFFGNGQPLLVGTSTYQLVPQPSTEDMTHIEVAMLAPSKELIRLPESMLSGGNLGGLLKFRAESLDLAQNNIGRIAQAIVSTVNAQHRLGQTLSGEPAGDFFKSLSPSVLGAPTNQGSLLLDATVTVSDYRVAYDGANYNVTRLSDNHRFDPIGSFPLVVDGVRLDLAAGTPQAGDIFVIRPDLAPAERVTKLQSGSNAVLTSTGSNVQTLVDSDFRLTFTDANTLTLTRLSDNTSWVGIGTSQAEALKSLMGKASPLGFSLDIGSGTAMIGDSFLVRPSRNGARDITLAIGDARDIAAAQGFSTSISTRNAGTGTISAGSVEKTDTPLSAPVKLTFEAGTNLPNGSLIGFPVGSTVLVGQTKYVVSDPAQRIPYSTGTAISFGGAAFTLTGVPANGDSFIINPPPTVPVTPAGMAGLFGTPALTTQAAGIGTLAGAIPLTFTPGVDDAFDVEIDNSGTPITVNLNATYADVNALIQDIQTKVGAGATVSVSGGQVMIASATTGGSSNIQLTQFGANTGLARLFNVPTEDTRATAVSGVTLTNPTTIATGVNDSFRIALDGGLPVTITLPEGSYTPATLATALQTRLDAALPDGATVSRTPTDELMITSNTVGVPSAVVLSGINLGAAAIAAATPPSTFGSLPAAPITLTFRPADVAAGLPARLIGFPAGSTVMLTQADGSTREYAMNTADGFTDAANFADYIPYTSGATIRVNGMRFEISGVPADGDTFTLEPNPSGTGDNRNMQAIAALQLANTMADSTATFQGGYSRMVSQVGNQTREIEVTLTAQENLVKQGNDAIQSMSGVNLDEEAANLLRYQQAYQAAAKMIEMSSKLFELLLTMGR